MASFGLPHDAGEIDMISFISDNETETCGGGLSDLLKSIIAAFYYCSGNLETGIKASFWELLCKTDQNRDRDRQSLSKKEETCLANRPDFISCSWNK